MQNAAQKKAIVTIYSKPGCHLCEVAKANIEASADLAAILIEEVNIEEDAALKEQYQYDIPVIFINGVKAFKHTVEPQEFQRKLRRLAAL
ncbi:MAG: glutaredoxin family protein [Acidobacteria bacterium]|nr:glutaredoxin family protein [Acidobacteriota bacterium]